MRNLKFYKILAHQRGDMLIEALASTLVLGFMVVGITQASRVMLGGQRDAVLEEMFIQQARQEVHGFTDTSACTKTLTGMVNSNHQSSIVLDCDKKLSATVDGKEVTDITGPKTATVTLGALDKTYKVGLRAKAEE